MRPLIYLCLFCLFQFSFIQAQQISPDLSFGTDGFATTPVLSGYFPFQMEVYPDGAVALGSEGDQVKIAAHRLLADGSLDPNFGDNGIRIFSYFDYDYAYLQDMEVLSNNTIVFNVFNSYHDYYYDHGNLVLMALDINGNTTYSKEIDITSESDDRFRSIEEFGNSSIRIAGDYFDPGWDLSSYDDVDYLSVYSFNSTGGGGGSNSSFAMDAQAYHTAGLPGGGFLVAGRFDGKGAIMHNTGNGSYNSNFGNQGFALEITEIVSQVYVLPNQKILAYAGAQSNKAIYRLHPNGQLDTDFADNGILSLNALGFPTDQINILPDGRFMLAVSDGRILQYLPDGTLNPAFGDNGIYTVMYDGTPLSIRDFQWAEDNTFTVFGVSNGQMVVGRYNLEVPSNDLGVVQITAPNTASDLTASETISIMIQNYGTASQSDFEVSYQIDNGTPVTEFLNITLLPGESYTHEFATPADLSEIGTYQIIASTNLGADGALYNDAQTITVHHLAPIDAGIENLINFEGCGQGLGVQFNLKNAGANPLTQATFEIWVDGALDGHYTWNGNLNYAQEDEIQYIINGNYPGPHEVQVVLLDANGAADVNPDNNTLDGTAFEGNASTDQLIFVEFRTDSYAGETTWQIRDENGTLLHSSGTYTLTNYTFTDYFCQPEGLDCYTLIIEDEYGDGWNGYLRITNGQGQELLYAEDFDDYEAEYSFCMQCLDGEANYAAIGADDPFAGMIDLDFTSGQAPFQYSIDGGQNFQADPIFTDLAPGTYNILVQDATGCTWEAFIDILECGISVTYDLVEPTAPDFNDGKIFIYATNTFGGLGEVMYSIDGGQSFHTNWGHHDLSTGTYDLVVVDLENCTWTETVELVGCALNGEVDITAVSEAGAEDGILLLNAFDGNGDLSYKVEGFGDFQADPLYENMPAGTYNTYILDAQGCEWIETVTIPVCALSADVTTIPTNGSSPSGKIIFQPINSNGTVMYSIDGGDTFQSNHIFKDLPAGTYALVVEDAYGCIWTGSATVSAINIIAEVEAVNTQTESGEDANPVINQTQELPLDSPGYQINSWPNPTSDVLNLRLVNFEPSLQIQEIEVLDIYGRMVLKQPIKETNQTLQIHVENLVPGTYVWILKGKNYRSTGRFMKQ